MNFPIFSPYIPKKIELVSSNSLIGDCFLNITNHNALDVTLKYNKIGTLSIENELEDIESITKNYQNINAVVFIYGRIELMMMKNGLIKNIKKNHIAMLACKIKNTPLKIEIKLFIQLSQILSITHLIFYIIK